MKYKSFRLLHLCRFRLAADCQCEHVRETVVARMSNSVTNVRDMLSLMVISTPTCLP